MTKDMVLVLMSTYNGELYLEEQIKSIFAQKDVEVQLLVRDDGSTDSTQSILKKWEKEMKLKWYSGTNIGPAKSFLELLKNAPKADFYAFSDQDDFWLPDKLSVAVKYIKKNDCEKPNLYCCKTQLVDENLSFLKNLYVNPNNTFGESLIFQFVSGCTMVFNNKLANLINQFEPSYLLMHDVWIYVICRAVDGEVYYDEIPHILYRQHLNNVVGASRNILLSWKKRFQRTMKGKENVRWNIAQQLLIGYANYIPNDNLHLLEQVVYYKSSFFDKMKLIFNKNITCGDFKTNIYSRVSVFFGFF